MPQIRILAVAAGRGGTGKSTLAYAVADTLRRLDPTLDVVLVDLDPQAGLTGYAKRAPAADPLHDAPVDAVGLTFFRGGRALAHASDVELTQHLERALAGPGDRVLVVDLSPALTDAAHRVVFQRDDVMLLGAIKTEPGSFQSLNELVAYVSRRGLPYILVPTIHRPVLLNNTMLLTMRQQHAGHVADVVFPLDGKAAECVVAGQPVTMYAKRSKAARAVTTLVEELFGTASPAEATASLPLTPGASSSAVARVASNGAPSDSSDSSARVVADAIAATGAGRSTTGPTTGPMTGPTTGRTTGSTTGRRR